MKNLKSTVLFFMSMALLFTGCSKNEEKKTQPKKNSCSAANQSLRINICTEPGTLDPRKARSLNDFNVIKMLQEGLTRVIFDGSIKLALAESIEVSKDQKTYTIKIKDAKWSNGDPISSYDFAHSWKSALSPKFPAPNAGLMFCIKNAKEVKEGHIPTSMLGVSTPDTETLVVQLNKPTPFFLELLATPTFFPIHSTTDKGTPHWADNEETYVGCGPFKIKSWKHSNSLVVEKNDGYYDRDEVKLKEITMVMVSAETGYNMYQNGELDWEGSPLSLLPLDSMDSLSRSNLLNTQAILSTTFMRTNVKEPPFNSEKVRKAFAYAIDRRSIINDLFSGHPDFATGLVPKVMGLREKEYFADNQKEDGRRLLESAINDSSISKRDLEKIKLTFISREKNYRLAQVIQQQIKQNLDIDIELDAVESQVYFSRISKKDYQLTISSWEADFRDPINFLEVFKTKDIGTNNTNWSNDNYLAKIEKSYDVIDPKERLSLLKECESILIDEMPIIPLFHGKMHYVKNHKVKNVVFSESGGIDFKWAFIDNK